jgi:signal transduction histidine kinase
MSPTAHLGAPSFVPSSMSISIRSHLLLWLLGLTVPAVLCAGFLAVSASQGRREATERLLHDSSRTMSLLVEKELRHRAAIARMLARSHWLSGTEITAAEMAGFRDMALHGLEGSTGWVELRSVDGVLLDTRLPPGAPPPEAASPQSLHAAPALLPPAAGAGLPDTAVVEPVMHDGQLRFNVAVSLPTTELQRIVDEQAARADATGMIIDRQGVVVAQSRGAPSAVGRQAPAELLAPPAVRRQELAEPILTLGASDVAYSATSRGGWTFVSGVSRSRYDALPASTLRVLLAGTVLLALVAAAALAMARRLASPVKRLKANAQRMKTGLSVTHQPTGFTEWDELSRALAEASDVLRDNRQQLERQASDAVAHLQLAEQRISQGYRITALGRLTGTLAHDFNNLLGTIGNSTQLMLEQPCAADLERPITSTLRAIEAGSQLTRQVLRFGGRRPTRLQAVALMRFLPEVQDLLRMVLGPRVEIASAVAPDTAAVCVDPGELELALVNLALNARDAMPRGGELRLLAETVDAAECEGLPPLKASQTWVRLSVSDDGQGIAPDLVDKVFEPFFTTKPVGRGLGLGLSQVHGFCEQAGGTARLASTPGLGTTVSLLLPSAVEEALDGDPIHPVETRPPPVVAGVHVLLVEDHDDVGHATVAMLRGHGAPVVRVTDAAKALALLKGGASFDVVLSDIVMPGEMDGHALAAVIQAEYPALPVVLISGFHPTMQISGFRVLGKPCPEGELLRALSDAALAAPVSGR